MVVGYAGMMTADLEPRMRDIPDVSKCPRTEGIIQESHRYTFDHQIRQTGAKLVEMETREEMIAAINPKTVAIHFTNILSDKGKVSGPEFFFSSRRRHTRWTGDWSSDVCSSDLVIFSRSKSCVPLADAQQRACDYCDPHAGAWYRGQRGHLHAGAGGAPEAARQP